MTSPLPPGIVLAERFVIEDVLGQGGFGIAYRAHDGVRGDMVVVKELAPQGVSREGVNLNLDSLGQATAQRLRQRFIEEAKVMGKLNLRGIPAVRSSFAENGTAYFVSDYLPGTVTLESRLAKQSRIPIREALAILYQVLEILEQVHHRGILHRDVKPSNILLHRNGDVTLIDFGAAREWHLDSTITHTVQYTPGYAPPEQMSEKARRGPATDLYAVAATFYEMIVGRPPASAPERMSGTHLATLASLRPEVDTAVSDAIDQTLALKYGDRPQSVEDLKKLLVRDVEGELPHSLAEADAKLVQLQNFRYDKRGCPACNGLLVEPKPLRKGQCPACHQGLIRNRQIDARLCASCRAGVLHLKQSDRAPVVCPRCSVGLLDYKKKSLLSPDRRAVCPECLARVELTAEGASLDGEAPKSLETWVLDTGRSNEVWACDGCGGQFDVLTDGRWQQMRPKPTKYSSLIPDEWARVAAGLDPGAGNAACDACGADYFVDGDRLTLLGVDEDPHGFADAYEGRLLNAEDVRWLGAGKESPNPGFVCDQCHTEFDRDGTYLRLVRSNNSHLIRRVGEPFTLEDWHRIVRGLPTISEEDAFVRSFDGLVLDAYESGRIGFDPDNVVIWKGPATNLDDDSSSNLTITSDEISFGSMLRKQRFPTDTVRGASASDSVLTLHVSGEREPLEFDIEPMDLEIRFESGLRSVTLDARNLAKRLVKLTPSGA